MNLTSVSHRILSLYNPNFLYESARFDITNVFSFVKSLNEGSFSIPPFSSILLISKSI